MLFQQTRALLPALAVHTFLNQMFHNKLNGYPMATEVTRPHTAQLLPLGGHMKASMSSIQKPLQKCKERLCPHAQKL